MNFLKRLFGKIDKTRPSEPPLQIQDMPGEQTFTPSIEEKDKTSKKPLILQEAERPDGGKETSGLSFLEKRSIRVFVSSTFRDMIEDRNELMTHCWPELRKFCAERHVELTEVDMRWGISEEQSTRRETLKLCLDEIRACRPFFIGLLGERYGWIPGDDAFTADLIQEQPWLKDINGKSVTELEILHGVLNNPEMAERAFFYFRDPAYAIDKGEDFQSENKAFKEKKNALKDLIRRTCKKKDFPLYEDYPSPQALAPLVFKQLKDHIETQFPIADIPDPLDREALDHEAFAGMRRRTYIGRPDYYRALDNHCNGEGTPLLLLGDSGSGKSALFANWAAHWKNEHPRDFIFQHYIGGTPDSSGHWTLMTRLIKEIKRWTEDQDELPHTHDDILRDFTVWLVKARIKADQDGVRFIILLDALNQLDDTDHGHLLGWLPEHPFHGTLRLMVSTLPGETLQAVENRNWQTLRIQPLKPDERRRMIVAYLKRFGKQLDETRLDRLSVAPSAANPLYLKILLDELRVTGTHDKLDERLDDYLEAPDIPSLLQKVLKRYRKDYERDRPGLVGDALGLIRAARRGLAENELLQLLKPDTLPQLPLATWAPLRAALEEGLVERGGILNFAHDFLREAVETAFLPNLDIIDDFREALADYFEAQHPTARTCDELPWLLKQTGKSGRLRNCLLDMDNFLLIFARDKDELRQYWAGMGDVNQIGVPYLESFNSWADNPGLEVKLISFAANQLAVFLSFELSIHKEAEPLFERALKISEKCYGKNSPIVSTGLSNLAVLLKETNRLKEAKILIERALWIYKKSYGPDHPKVATVLNNLAQLLKDTNRLKEAEPLMERVLRIDEKSYGPDHPTVATALNNLAALLFYTNRLNEAEPLYERALKIDEKSYGAEHPIVARDLNNLARLLTDTNRLKEAKPLMERALRIHERSYGKDHPKIAQGLNNMAGLLQGTNRFKEAEPLMERAIRIAEKSYGPDHPTVAIRLSNLATLLYDTNRLKEAEPLMKRALRIAEKSYGLDSPTVALRLNNLAMLLLDTNRIKEAEPLIVRALRIDEKSYGPDHPTVARDLSNLANLLHVTNRLKEAEPLMERVLKIHEKSYGPNHPTVAIGLSNLAMLLQDINRLKDAEPLMERVVEIIVNFSQTTGHQHPNLQTFINNYVRLLLIMGWSEEEVIAKLRKMGLNFK